jgi:hypothetical protein
MMYISMNIKYTRIMYIFLNVVKVNKAVQNQS